MPQVIDSPPAYSEFRQKAGSYITPMCEHMNIYWLNAVAPPLPVGNTHYTTLPEPIRVRINDTPLPITDVKAPPPVNVYRQQQSERNNGPKAPPPLALYQQGQANENVEQTERVAMTPPPLALWRQQNTN